MILADTEEEHYAPVEKIKSDRVVKDSELYREAIRSREEQASDQETQAQKNADNAEDTNKQEGQESETPTAYFPLFFNLNGADVLIVGAGKIASAPSVCACRLWRGGDGDCAGGLYCDETA